MIERFTIFNPARCHFPPPRLPHLPQPGRSSLGIPTPSTFETVADLSEATFFSRGRYALRSAYKQAGIGPEASLLAPAYHCRTMIDPAVRRAAQVIAYPVNTDLSPDWDALQYLVDISSTRPAALLLTHYFGFAQDGASARAFCDANGLLLIEDCSHAYYRHQSEGSIGRFGDLLICSPYKFVPSDDGGLLWALKGSPDASESLAHRNLVAEAKAFARTAQRWLSRRNTPQPNSSHLPGAGSGANSLGETRFAPANSLSDMYDVSAEISAGFRSSRLIMALSDTGRIAHRRRDIYARWLNGVQDLPNCDPLFATLPDHCVPYMFPLIINSPDIDFGALKHAGIPIWRWDEMGESSCRTAQHYREHLIHLPCHQDVTDQELDWMLGEFKRVLSASPGAKQ